MKAVHFGAGNIGRGFVGLLLSEAGYEIVFADVNAELINALAASTRYCVHEVGADARTSVVEHYRAVNTAADPEAVVAEIASAHVVTTAVGPNILRFIAPHILAALRERPAELPPLHVMACENAINATDVLRDEIASLASTDEWPSLANKAVFANTAVDRIVPGQAADAGLDVTVETYYEWAIESRPFEGVVPSIPGAHFVSDLAPYIERKLFTVNTGHAAIAYFGFLAGKEKISDALAEESVARAVRRALEETSGLLESKHGLDPQSQAAYRAKILDRFANEALPDTVERVGRQPLRKLSRNERFVAPAAELAAAGMAHEGLLDAIGAALAFDVPGDEESATMQRMLAELRPEAFVAEVTGIAPEHPLHRELVETVADRQVG